MTQSFNAFGIIITSLILNGTRLLHLLTGCRIEADQGTVVYIKESKETGFERHVIGLTESLDFYDPESVIEGIYFAGVHLEQATEAEAERLTPPKDKWIDTGEVVYTLDSIKHPRPNGVYTLQDAVLEVYPWDSGETSQVSVKPSREMTPQLIRNYTIPVFENQTRTVAPGHLALIMNRVVILVWENTVICDPEDVEFVKNLKRAGYKVMTKGSDEERGLIIVDNSQATKQADNNYALTIKNWDREFALILEEEIGSANKYIFYDGQWWLFTENEDLLCPVRAIIDYYCEIVKGYYAK